MLLAFSEQLIPIALTDALREMLVTQSHSQPSWVTIICVHGWTLDHRSFAPQRPLAELGVQVVRFDRRGFGNSRVRPDFQRELADLDALVGSFDTPVVLYGVSQGARLALRYAVLGKQQIAGLILQGGHVDGLAVDESPGDAIPFEMYRQWFERGEVDWFRQHWSRHPLVATGMGGLASDEIASLIDSYDGADLLSGSALPTSMDIRAELTALKLPVLAVVGSLETRSRKAHAAAIVSSTRAQELLIPGGGHLCNISHAAIVNDGISAWLKQLPLYTGKRSGCATD